MKSYVLMALVAVPLGAWRLDTALADDHCGGHHGWGHHGECYGCAPVVAASPDAMQSGSAAGRTYDPDTVTTLKGFVKVVTVVPARGGRSGGTHVTLESDGTQMEVQLGPTWFLEREGLKLAKGDALEVTGSLVDSDGSTFVVARDLKKGTQLLKLRDERGVPMWAGGPRR